MYAAVASDWPTNNPAITRHLYLLAVFSLFGWPESIALLSWHVKALETLTRSESPQRRLLLAERRPGVPLTSENTEDQEAADSWSGTLPRASHRLDRFNLLPIVVVVRQLNVYMTCKRWPIKPGHFPPRSSPDAQVPRCRCFRWCTGFLSAWFSIRVAKGWKVPSKFPETFLGNVSTGILEIFSKLVGVNASTHRNKV